MRSSTSAPKATNLESPVARGRERQTDKSTPVDGGSSQRAILTCVGLAGITIVALAAVRGFGFVDYDDFDYVASNPHVMPGLTWNGVRWAFTSGYAANWHPLTWISHMVDVQLFGMNAGAHHVVSLLLHVLNTLLLFGALRRMTGRTGRSAFVAALFAVHPMHVESVAWIAERKDVFSTLFWMLSLMAYSEYVRRSSWRWYAATLLCFTLGLMSKPMVVTLPFVLLLLDVWPLRRKLGRDVLLEKLPLVALAIASSVITLVAQRGGGAVVRLELMPLPVRFANAIVTYAQYILKLLWPIGLAAMYPARRTLPDPAALAGSLALLLGITLVTFKAARRSPYLMVGWLWFLGTLVPVIGIVQVGAQSMADRYSYIPSVGLFLIVIWGASDLVARWPRAKVAAQVSAALVVGACTVATMRQVRHWSSSRALWERAVSATRDNYFAQGSLGYVLWKEGHADEAIPHLEEALRLRPDFAEAHNNLGVVLAGRGDLRGAVSQFSEAVRIDPAYKAARDNLAATNVRLNTVDTTLTRFTESVRANPKDLAARNELGAALAARGRVDEAIDEFREAIRIDPNQPDVHFNLGAMLDRKGRTSEAIQQYQIALRLNPGHAAAREALDAIARRGRTP